MTVMRYRCSAVLTSLSSFCHGLPVGTKTTSSSANRACTSLAATRWPWWIGSNVPPITPRRRLSASPVDVRVVVLSAVRDLRRGVAEGPEDAQPDQERDERDHAV